MDTILEAETVDIGKSIPTTTTARAGSSTTWTVSPLTMTSPRLRERRS